MFLKSPTKAFVHSHLEHWGADLQVCFFLGGGAGWLRRLWFQCVGPTSMPMSLVWTDGILDLKAEAALEAQRGEDGPGSAVIQFTGAACHFERWRSTIFFGDMSDMVRWDFRFSCLGKRSPTVHCPLFLLLQKMDRERTGHSSRWHDARWHFQSWWDVRKGKGGKEKLRTVFFPYNLYEL